MSNWSCMAPPSLNRFAMITYSNIHSINQSHSLSLRFNGHFPGVPGSAGVYWSKGWWRWWVVVTTGAVSRAKLQSNHHHQQTNNQFFTGQMPFLSANQQCQSTEGKNITFHGLAYRKLTWGLPTLSLTTNSSWLPWGMVAIPCLSSALWCQYPNQSKYLFHAIQPTKQTEDRYIHKWNTST